MTGIQIPAALIPHQSPDPQLSRPALAVDKLAALMPVQDVSQGDVQSSTGETVQARQPNPLLPGAVDPRLGGRNLSTRETLSFAARAILDLFDDAEPQPLRGGTPLTSAPPAGADGTATLSTALAKLVDQSGMFYESHLAQWVNGQRPLSSLLQEPQAALRHPAPSPAQQGQPAAQPGQSAPAPAALLPYAGPAAPPTTAPPSATLLAELTRPAIYPLSTGVPASPAAPHQRPGEAAGQPGNGAPSPGATPQTPAAEQRRAAHASAAAHAYQVTAEVSHEGHHVAQAQRAAIVAAWNAPESATLAPPPDTGPPIHPASEGAVRQQLELLATQQFRATIDAWPGMPVDWEITREQPREHDAHAGGTEAASWSTRLRLNLPQLGSVDAVLTLGAHGIEARLLADSPDTAARLTGGRADFRAQLEARGLALLNMNVSIQDGPAAPDTAALPA
ncbi:flagellar hook-length control protein FliK [Cupriavidus agavae]|uniref:Flagellar hook-length control protein FliK n=1 Tax=Cupriavidus agavae TaxID=1001822 RepID=A0A4Q7RCG8_9BURK|nr:flagellar hook-length control protein FliK [Cupriavidus agavae]RZT30833.1 flagellar hook-length control protein FliK [Cupriavidus agavae]